MLCSAAAGAGPALSGSATSCQAAMREWSCAATFSAAHQVFRRLAQVHHRAELGVHLDRREGHPRAEAGEGELGEGEPAVELQIVDADVQEASASRRASRQEQPSSFGRGSGARVVADALRCRSRMRFQFRSNSAWRTPFRLGVAVAVALGDHRDEDRLAEDAEDLVLELLDRGRDELLDQPALGDVAVVQLGVLAPEVPGVPLGDLGRQRRQARRARRRRSRYGSGRCRRST